MEITIDIDGPLPELSAVPEANYHQSARHSLGASRPQRQ
jgi:hypothetical protein